MKDLDGQEETRSKRQDCVPINKSEPGSKTAGSKTVCPGICSHMGRRMENKYDEGSGSWLYGLLMLTPDEGANLSPKGNGRLNFES
jgi:hypothetical protein